MKLSACIEWIFADETDDIVERIRLAKSEGLAGVEFHQWQNKPLDAIKAAIGETDVALTSMIVEPRRSLVDPTQHEEFFEAVRESLKAATRVGCPALVVASGFTLADTPKAKHRAAIVRALRQAAKMAADAGKVLLLEPLNDRVDHPGMYLCDVVEGLEIVEEIDSAALRLLFDVYHAHVMGQSFAETAKGRVHLIGHVQVADSPGRGEPGSGEIAWRAVSAALRANGYDGFVGLEFKPKTASREALRLTKAALT